MILLMKRAIRTATAAQQTRGRASNFESAYVFIYGANSFPGFIAPSAARVLTKEGKIEPTLRVRNEYLAVSTNDINLVRR
jgi:hypothetical protein